MSNDSDTRIPLICLLGPTGAGKTAAALHIADTFGAGVVNFDSRQVYRDFPIITAQPESHEISRCPHRLYGFLETTEKITAGTFVEMAHRAIDETRAEGLVPILVGGTGLYSKALLEGLAPIPAVEASVGEYLENCLEREGLASLREKLEEVDPEYAAKIHPNDTQRTLRALEVFEGTGHPLTWWHSRPVPPPRYRAVKLGIASTLDALTPRLRLRIEQMLERGAVDEARAAREKCGDPEAPGWSGIGCAELFRHLAGELSLEETVELWLKNTRAYAKRQFTWFRKEEGVHWVDPTDFDAMNRAVRTELM